MAPDARLRVSPDQATPFSPLGTPLPRGLEIVSVDTSDDVHVEIEDGETLIITKETRAVRQIDYTIEDANGDRATGRIVLPFVGRGSI